MPAKQNICKCMHVNYWTFQLSTTFLHSTVLPQNDKKVYRYSDVGIYHFGQKNPEIWVESQVIFYETVLMLWKNSLQILDYLLKYSSFYVSEWNVKKFPSHWLNFPVSSLSSMENNNYRKSSCKIVSTISMISLSVCQFLKNP